MSLSVFSLFGEDATGDASAKKYFEEVKSVMYNDDTANTTTVDGTEGEKPDGDERVRFKIGYLSYIKIILVLGLVILIIYGISLILKRALRLKGQVSEDAAVITTQALGPGKWLQVVFVGGKYLVLGVTNDSINLVTEITDPVEIERYELIINERQTATGKTFIDIFSDFVKERFRTKPAKTKFDYETDTMDFLKSQKNRLNNFNNHKDFTDQ